MATIRRLRGRWQAQVRRKGIPPRAKSFDTKIDAEKWARDLEAELDRCDSLPDTRLLEKGWNVIKVATVSGHQELKMLQRCSHLRAEDLVVVWDSV